MNAAAELIKHARFEPSGAQLLAAAGAVIGRDVGARDPAVAFLAALGGAALAGTDQRDRLTELAHAVPRDDRLAAVGAAEPLLVKIDAHWGAGLLQELVGIEVAVGAAIGLQFATALSGSQGVKWNEALDRHAVLARQRTADATARAAIAGQITSRDDPRLQALHGTGEQLLPSEARVLLAAAAAVDPAWALDAVSGMLLTRVEPRQLADGLRLVAAAAAGAGLIAQLEKRVATDSYVTVQATWLAAAAAAGALDADQIAGQARELAERAEDELDPGRELIAGLPLLDALASTAQLDAYLDLARRWRVPPPLLVDRLFWTGAAATAGQLSGGGYVERLLEVPEHSWSQLYAYSFGWWPVAGENQAGAVLAALDVVAARPLWPVPGSLADLVGWVGRRPR